MVTLLSDGYVTLSGVILSGEDTATGVTRIMESFEGWGAAGPRMGMAPKPRSNGAWAGTSYLNARSVSASGVFIATTAAAAQAAVDELISACSLRETTLMVTESGVSRSIGARRSGEVIVDWLSPRECRWSIQLLATDPRKYGTALTGSTALASSSGGFKFEPLIGLRFPFAINSTVVSGQVHLFNPGNIAGPVSLRIDGPVTAPIVTHVTSGQSLVFASSLVLGAGQWITVNMERREVLENGQSSRNGWVTSRGWSSFAPGDNTWTFAAGSYDPGSLLTVTASPTWE